MQIHVWPSFCSNNSSSFSLVAQFSSESIAAEVAAELAEFFATHAKQVDAFDDYEERLSDAQIALAKKHDITWATEAPLYWGEVELVGDEPEVAAAEKKVVVYHGYCGGGLDLQPYLEARGAVDLQFGEETPTVTARFELPAGQVGAGIRKQLEAFFAQDARLSNWQQGPPWAPNSSLPWADADEAACYCDTELATFQLPISLSDLEARDYLARNDIEAYRLTLCDTTELQRLRRLSIAKQCPECRSRALKLFAEASAEVKDQIACLDCGGMFDLAAFEAAPRRLMKLSDEHLHGIDGAGDVIFAAAGMILNGQIWRLRPDAEWEMVETTRAGSRGWSYLRGNQRRRHPDLGRRWEKVGEQAERNLEAPSKHLPQPERCAVPRRLRRHAAATRRPRLPCPSASGPSGSLCRISEAHQAELVEKNTVSPALKMPHHSAARRRLPVAQQQKKAYELASIH